MFPRGVLIATLVILEVAYSLPLEEKIEPVELFHHCIEPERYESEPHKSPVLLLHGLLGNYRSYEGVDQVIANKTGRRVCAVDLRNHGNSPWSNQTDIAAFAVDVGHFLDQQNISKVNFIGESLGGKIAIHYALNNPDRVDSLVAEDIRPNSVKRIAFLTIKFLVRVLRRILDSQPENMSKEEAMEWASQLYKKIRRAFPKELPEDPSKYADLRLVDGKWSLKHNLGLLFEKISKPEEIWIESTGLYTGPTLFIYGVESFFKVNEDEEDILKLFPNAKLVPLEGTGHIIHQIDRRFDDIAVKFLNGLH